MKTENRKQKTENRLKLTELTITSFKTFDGGLISGGNTTTEPNSGTVC